MAVRPEESVEEVTVPFAARSDHAGPQVGANQRKQMVAFVPVRDNEDFQPVEGQTCGKSFPYSHLGPIDFALDYSWLVLTFLSHRVTVSGRNLKSHLDNLESHRLDLIEQKLADPFLTAKTADEATLAANQLVVTGLKLEPITD